MSDEEEFDESMEEDENSEEESDEEESDDESEDEDEDDQEQPPPEPPQNFPPVRISGLQRLYQIQASLSTVSSSISHLRAKSGWNSRFAHVPRQQPKSVQFGPSLLERQMGFQAPAPRTRDQAISKTSLYSLNSAALKKENKNFQTDPVKTDKKLSVPRFDENAFKKSVQCQTSIRNLPLRGRTIEEEINRRTFDPRARESGAEGWQRAKRSKGFRPVQGRVKISDQRIDELYLQRNRNSGW